MVSGGSAGFLEDVCEQSIRLATERLRGRSGIRPRGAAG